MPVKGHKRIESNQTLPSATTRGNRKSSVQTSPEDGEPHAPKPPSRGCPNKNHTRKIAARNHVSSRSSVEVKDKGHLETSTLPTETTPSTGNIEALFGALNEIEQMVINVALHEIYSKCRFNKRSTDILRNRFSMYAVPVMAPLQSSSYFSIKEYVQKTRRIVKPDPKDKQTKCQSTIKIRHTKKSADAKEQMLKKRRDNAQTPTPTKKSKIVVCNKDLGRNIVRQPSGHKQGHQNAKVEVISREGPSLPLRQTVTGDQNPTKAGQRQKSTRVKKSVTQDDSSSCIYATLPKDSIEYVRHTYACAKCSPYAKNGNLPEVKSTKSRESTSSRLAKPKKSAGDSVKCAPTPPKELKLQQANNRSNRVRRVVKKADKSENKPLKGFLSPEDGVECAPVEINSAISTIGSISTEGSFVSTDTPTSSVTTLPTSPSFTNDTLISEGYGEDLPSNLQFKTQSPLHPAVPEEQDEHCACCKAKSSIERRAYGVQTEMEVDDCATQCDDDETVPMEMEIESVCGTSTTDSLGNVELNSHGTAQNTRSTSELEEQYGEQHSEKCNEMHNEHSEVKSEEKRTEKPNADFECENFVENTGTKSTVTTDTSGFFDTEVTEQIDVVDTQQEDSAVGDTQRSASDTSESDFTNRSTTSLYDDDDDIVFGNSNRLELSPPAVDEAIATERPYKMIDSRPDPPDNSELIKNSTEASGPDMTDECSDDGDLRFIDMYHIATAVLQYSENMSACTKVELSRQAMPNEACVSNSTFGVMKDIAPNTDTRQDSIDYDDDDDIIVGESREKNEIAEPVPPDIPEEPCQCGEHVKPNSVVQDSAKCEYSAPEITEAMPPKLEPVTPQIAGMSTPTKEYLLPDTSEKAAMDPVNGAPDTTESASLNIRNAGSDVVTTRDDPHPLTATGSNDDDLRFIDMHQKLQRIATSFLQYAENMDACIKVESSPQTKPNGTDEARVSKSTFGEMKDLDPKTVTRRDSIDYDDDDDIMFGESREKAVLQCVPILNTACKEDPCSSFPRTSLHILSSAGVNMSSPVGKMSSVVVGMSSAGGRKSSVSGCELQTLYDAPDSKSTTLHEASAKFDDIMGQLSKWLSNTNPDDNDDIVFGSPRAHTIHRSKESACVPIINSARAEDPCVRKTRHDVTSLSLASASSLSRRLDNSYSDDDDDIVFGETAEKGAPVPNSEDRICIPDVTPAVTTISPPSCDGVSSAYDIESPSGSREFTSSSDSTATPVVCIGSIANVSRRLGNTDSNDDNIVFGSADHHVSCRSSAGDRELGESRSASPVSIYSSPSIGNISGSPGNNGSQTSVFGCDCQDDALNANNSSSAPQKRSLKDAISSRRSRPLWYQGLASMGFLPSVVVRSKYTKISHFPGFNIGDERRRE